MEEKYIRSIDMTKKQSCEKMLPLPGPLPIAFIRR